MQLPLNAGSSVLREDLSAPENDSASSPFAQQLIKAEQLPMPPPQSASFAHGAVPQLHLQVLRNPAPDGSAGTAPSLGVSNPLTAYEKFLSICQKTFPFQETGAQTLRRNFSVALGLECGQLSLARGISGVLKPLRPGRFGAATGSRQANAARTAVSIRVAVVYGAAASAGAFEFGRGRVRSSLRRQRHGKNTLQ
jgi:hypothetical protein